MKNTLKLYLVTDREQSLGRNLEEVVSEAVKGGVSIVQLREKHASTGEFLDLALRLREILKPYDVPLIINDRIDIALAVDSDGVHLGQDDMPADVARKIIGDKKILGVSAATVKEAKKAQIDGADYIGSGAVFPTSTKDDADSVSKEELIDIVGSIDIPVVAIGGITLENASLLKDTGISGFSVVSAIMSADNPKDASSKLKEIYFS